MSSGLALRRPSNFGKRLRNRGSMFNEDTTVSWDDLWMNGIGRWDHSSNSVSNPPYPGACMTYGLYHQVEHLRRQALLPFFHHRLRQTVAIPEKAILRRAMIGSLIAANRSEKKSGSMRANQFFCFLLPQFPQPLHKRRWSADSPTLWNVWVGHLRGAAHPVYRIVQPVYRIAGTSKRWALHCPNFRQNVRAV